MGRSASYISIILFWVHGVMIKPCSVLLWCVWGPSASESSAEFVTIVRFLGLREAHWIRVSGGKVMGLEWWCVPGWQPQCQGRLFLDGLPSGVVLFYCDCPVIKFSSVQSLSPVRLFATLWTTAHQASLSITDSWSLLRLMSIELVMPSNHLILCCPLLLPPSIFPSMRVFSSESVLCIRWAEYWSFSFNITPSNECSGLIYFRMGWLNLLAVQGTFKSLLQHHSSKASIPWCLAFFIIQLSHSYMTTGKTIVLTRWTFIGKVMSLLFNMLSRLVITFLPRNKHLVIKFRLH